MAEDEAGRRAPGEDDVRPVASALNCAHGVPVELRCGACEGPAHGGSIDATLSERGSRYGSFAGHAAVTQRIKHALAGSDKWHTLTPDQKEALEMIAHKMGRIVNGDPNYHDSWHDIVGYAKLVADRLA